MAGRRPKGDGSIFQRSDGRWCGKLSQPDGSVKRYYAQTKHDVQVRLRAALKALDDGLPIVKNEQLTVGQLLTQWLELAVKLRVRASTFRGYEAKVRTHIFPALGGVRVTT